jgi:hypothetical protein
MSDADPSDEIRGRLAVVIGRLELIAHSTGPLDRDAVMSANRATLNTRGLFRPFLGRVPRAPPMVRAGQRQHDEKSPGRVPRARGRRMLGER